VNKTVKNKSMTAYGYYRPASLELRADIKRAIRNDEFYGFEGIPSFKEFKKMKWQALWLDLNVKGILGENMLTQIIFMENAWKNNPVCLVPESADLKETLKGIRIEGVLDKIKTPATVFTVSIPKGMLFNGEKINGCLVSKTSHTSSNKMLRAMGEEYNVSGVPENQPVWDYIADRFTLTYQIGTEKMRYVANMCSSKLTNILSSKDYAEYESKLGRNSMGDGLTREEITTQYELLRFVLGMLVYTSSGEGSITKIDSIYMDAPGETKKIKVAMSRINHFKVRNGVSPHYRQLSAERYYQGDWHDWERGSRFIPVNMELSLVDKA